LEIGPPRTGLGRWDGVKWAEDDATEMDGVVAAAAALGTWGWCVV
jgi:hypothetical protein